MLIEHGLSTPLFILGLLGQIYPMLHLRRQHTTTTLDAVGKLLDSGPCARVRQPQFASSMVMLIGWFLVWGEWYALCALPLMLGIVYVPARVVEEHTLDKMFRATHTAYRARVGMLLAHLAANSSLRITTAFLGSYAGLLAIQHGSFEMTQGSRAPDGLLINAIGPPCQREMVWHACFPAMTLIPNLVLTGISALLIGLAMAVWAVAFGGRRRGGIVLGALSLLALLVGGGFVTCWIGLVAAAAASALRVPVKPGGAGWRIVSALWPWLLALMAVWMPGSWLLGHFLSATMLDAGGLLFLVFDLGLPVLAAVSGFGRTKRPGGGRQGHPKITR